MQELDPSALAARSGCCSGGLQVHVGVQEPFTPARSAHPGLLVHALAARLPGPVGSRVTTVTTCNQVGGGPPDPPPRRAGDVALLLAVLVQVAVLLAWPRVVTVDGPAHLAGAAALLHHGDAAHALYQVDARPTPNLLTSVVLAGLLHVLGPDGAERLLVLALVVGLPLALRYALRAVHPQAGWQAVVAVPFGAGYLSTYGFYNFELGLVGALLVAGYALRRGDGWTARTTAGLAVLLTLTWAAHLLPLLVAALLLTVLALCRVRTGRGRDGTRAGLVRHVVPVVLAGLPVLALTAVFLLDTPGSRGAAVRTSSVPALLLGLLDLGRPLVAWTSWEYVGSALVAAGLVALGLLARRRRERSPERAALAVTGLLLTGWYCASPDRYGPAYGFLNDRLALFPPLLLVLWAAAPYGARQARAGLGLVLAGTIGLAAAQLPTQVRYQRDVAEFLSVAPDVPRGSTLVALRLWRDAPVGPDARNRARDPLRHEAGRLAVLRGAVDVGDYQAVTDYFPTRWVPATDPRRPLDPDLLGLEQVPPRVDLAEGPQVVLLVGRGHASPATLAGPATAALLDQLGEHYRRTATSPRSGLVEVWERTDGGGVAAGTPGTPRDVPDHEEIP